MIASLDPILTVAAIVAVALGALIAYTARRRET